MPNQKGKSSWRSGSLSVGFCLWPFRVRLSKDVIDTCAAYCIGLTALLPTALREKKWKPATSIVDSGSIITPMATTKRGTEPTIISARGSATAGQEIWSFVSKLVEASPSRLIIQAKVVDWVFANVIVEEPKHSFDEEAIEFVLDACRKRYGRTCPPFPKSVFFRLNGGCTLQLEERVDALLLSSLPPIHDALPNRTHLPKVVPAESLNSLVMEGIFLLPNTRLVQLREQKYIIKGPIYRSRVKSDFLELRNTLRLAQGCPYIIPPPSALITISGTDKRLCGWLMPFYPNGNLDLYAQKIHLEGKLSVSLLCRWFRQLVHAVKFLASHETWHGDIKPDNILIGDNEDIILIDHARVFTTSATASPEVRRHCMTAHLESIPSSNPEHEGDLRERMVNSDLPAVGMPLDWSLERVIPSEIYSIGRTMFLVCEGISMIDIYREFGWINHELHFNTTFEDNSNTPICLRDIISKCTALPVAERITLTGLENALKTLVVDIDI